VFYELLYAPDWIGLRHYIVLLLFINIREVAKSVRDNWLMREDCVLYNNRQIWLLEGHTKDWCVYVPYVLLG